MKAEKLSLTKIPKKFNKETDMDIPKMEAEYPLVRIMRTVKIIQKEKLGKSKLLIYHKVSIHNGYAEWEEAKEEGVKLLLMFGKYHHIFYSKKGKISLFKYNYLKDIWYWEIKCLQGNLFEDTERFTTKYDAVKRIEELLI